MPRKETKQRILSAASELFSTCGYDDVTMRELAKKVGITEGAIYRHFEGKAQILDEIILCLREKLDWIFHLLDEERMDNFIETEGPREVLEKCRLRFPKEDYVFMANSFSIVLQEHLTNSAAKEIIVHQLYYHAAERIKYVLDRLQERGDIPKFDTSAYSLVWTRFSMSSLALWVSLSNSGISPEKAGVSYQSTMDWLIESALSGKLQ